MIPFSTEPPNSTELETMRGHTFFSSTAPHSMLKAFSVGLIIAITAALSHHATAVQPPEDQGQGPALSPAQSRDLFQIADGFQWQQLLTEPTIEQPLMATFDSHGRMWVVEYRQYPEPAGLKALSRDNFWRIVYDRMPEPPGHGGIPGIDKISIHEDKDGDGQYESHSTFVDGLNIATAVVPTEDGAWILNPPYLLFYPDKNHDSIADGSPEIHLQGFGLEDTHSVVNSLCMGPDGWLYAAQGSTVTGAVKSYNSDAQPLKSLGQAIWRYHPKTRQYEIFAEGGGNAFGVALNNAGEIFSGHNGGDTRGFHYYQGGYYRKGFNKHGSLSNPNSFGYLNPMKHPPIQRFTHTMLLTDGTSFPNDMAKSMIAVDPLHGKLIRTDLIRNGATYDTKDVLDLVSSKDKWFRPVAIADGPDGAAYVCDWYDFQVAHLYAHQGKMDREHGRIYRLAIAGPDESVSRGSSPNKPATVNVDNNLKTEIDPKLVIWNPILANAKSPESLTYLVEKLSHPIRWQRWMARRLIESHPLRIQSRQAIIEQSKSDSEYAIEHLWTAHLCGWLSDTINKDSAPNAAEESIANWLSHPDPVVRLWTIRLACDDRNVSSETLSSIVAQSKQEREPAVLCQLACSAKRLPAPASLTIIASLLSRDLPSDDPFLPLLIWWAVEQHADELELVQQKLLTQSDQWSNTIARQVVFPNLVQRWCNSRTKQSMAATASLIESVSRLPSNLQSDASKFVHQSFERAFEGKSLNGVPDKVIDALIALGQPSVTLRLRRGDQAAVSAAAEALVNRKSAATLRMQIAKITSEFSGNTAFNAMLDPLVQVASSSDEDARVRDSAIAALATFDRPEIGSILIEQWPTLTTDLRSTAGAVLATRSSWTEAWLTACLSQRVRADELPLESVRGMRQHDSPAIQKQLDTIYPTTTGLDFATVQKRCQDLSQLVYAGNGDPYRGKKQFKSLCARCHRLFDEGGEIGPDLTGYQRDQLNTLLRNIVAPSLEIREGYRTVKLKTEDGRILTGFVENQTDEQLTLRTIDGLSHTIDISEIENQSPQLQSLMPDGILDKLTDQEFIDLMSYLRSSQPLADG